MSNATTPATKTCATCGIEKELDQFHAQKSGRFGRTARCKPCMLAYLAEKRANNPEYKARQASWRAENKERKAELNARWYADNRGRGHGLKSGEYDTMLEAQNGLCAICHEPESKVDSRTGRVNALSIDHDHAHCDGPFGCPLCIRGLICYVCNFSLGHAENGRTTFTPDQLAYLARWSSLKKTG